MYLSAKRQHSELKLVNLSERLKELLRVTNLASVFEAHPALLDVSITPARSAGSLDAQSFCAFAAASYASVTSFTLASGISVTTSPVYGSLSLKLRVPPPVLQTPPMYCVVRTNVNVPLLP